MASATSRYEAALRRWVPAPVRRRFRGETGRRFARFVLVAVAAVLSSQIALVVFLDVAHMTAGLSGVLAAIVGAAVSYVLSRWAWERKGRPHVLKETLPFWIVSVAAWIVLGLATKLGVHWAAAAGLPPRSLQWHLVVNGTYFAANVLTFIVRFLIFHYVLFADRGSSGGVAGGAEPTPHSAAEGFAETLEESDGDGDGDSAAASTRRSPAAG
jgi:putative flippase GtrA